MTLVLSSLKPKRAVAPVELTVCEIEEQLEAFMKENGSRDLTDLLQEMRKEITWKNTAKPSTLARYSFLFCGLASISPQAVLPPKKTTLAFLGAHRKKACNFSGRNDQDWAEEQSSAVRACLAKFRELSLDMEAQRRCFSKASTSEKVEIQAVLAKMGGRSDSFDEQPSGMSKLEVATSISKRPSMQDFDAIGDVFQKFLCQLDEVGQSSQTNELALVSSETPRSVASTSYYSPREPVVRGSGYKELDETLLTIARATPPLPGKPRGQHTMVEQAKALRKRPAAASEQPVRARAKQEKVTKGTKAKAVEKVEKGQKVRDSTKKPTTSNCRELKNLHSKAYHRMLQACRKQGMKEEDAKEQARAAGREAKENYVRGL